ncbi:MAG: hypothetical protein QFX12_04180 [Rickettsia africae]|nr:hypothetical protein [Rickettsia africae]
MNHAQFTSSGYSFVNGLKAVTRYATASKYRDFETALKFFNMQQDNSLKICNSEHRKPASEDNENLFPPILI